MSATDRTTADPAALAESPIWARLQEQIAWYDAKSGASQSRFKLL